MQTFLYHMTRLELCRYKHKNLGSLSFFTVFEYITTVFVESRFLIHVLQSHDEQTWGCIVTIVPELLFSSQIRKTGIYNTTLSNTVMMGVYQCSLDKTFIRVCGNLDKLLSF